MDEVDAVSAAVVAALYGRVGIASLLLAAAGGGTIEYTLGDGSARLRVETPTLLFDSCTVDPSCTRSRPEYRIIVKTLKATNMGNTSMVKATITINRAGHTSSTVVESIIVYERGRDALTRAAKRLESLLPRNTVTDTLLLNIYDTVVLAAVQGKIRVIEDVGQDLTFGWAQYYTFEDLQEQQAILYLPDGAKPLQPYRIVADNIAAVLPPHKLLEVKVEYDSETLVYEAPEQIYYMPVPDYMLASLIVGWPAAADEPWLPAPARDIDALLMHLARTMLRLTRPYVIDNIVVSNPEQAGAVERILEDAVGEGCAEVRGSEIVVKCLSTLAELRSVAQVYVSHYRKHTSPS